MPCSASNPACLSAHRFRTSGKNSSVPSKRADNNRAANGIEKQTAKQMVMLEKLKTDYNADVAMMLANFIATEFQMWGDKPEGENQ
ncbi:MAG: hypothetical protein OXH47_10130 [Paracoccaceae bacterium]|nr:hypothetical protein [Paracoccaceae bacterium]